MHLVFKLGMRKRIKIMNYKRYVLALALISISFLVLNLILENLMLSNENDYTVQLKICSDYSKPIIRHESSQYLMNNVLSDLLKAPNEYLSKYLPKDYDKNEKSSYLLPLVTSILIEPGDIIEIGLNGFASPIINRIVIDHKRFVLSTDMNSIWLHNFLRLNNTFHHLVVQTSSQCVKTLNKKKEWGFLVLNNFSFNSIYVDLFKSLISNLNIVILTGTETSNSLYSDYETQIIKKFKYHCKYTFIYSELTGKIYKSTSLLSNYNNFAYINKVLEKIQTNVKFVICNNTL